MRCPTRRPARPFRDALPVLALAAVLAAGLPTPAAADDDGLRLPPAGHKYVRVAADILLIAIGTGIVIDAVDDLLR